MLSMSVFNLELLGKWIDWIKSTLVMAQNDLIFNGKVTD